jgi:hypothetical protein
MLFCCDALVRFWHKAHMQIRGRDQPVLDPAELLGRKLGGH